MLDQSPSLIERVIPALGWLRRYQREWLLPDLSSALAVGAFLVPQGLAFAQIVQVPVAAGLWAGIVAKVAYGLLGPSRQLMVGPEAGTAIMVAAAITAVGIEDPQQRLGASAAVAILVGLILLVAGVARLGAIAEFLSRPILAGYVNGIALVLIVSQLPGVLGIRGVENDFLPQLVEVASNAGALHWPTLLLSAAAIAILLVTKRVAPRVPAAVLVVAVSIVLSRLFGFEPMGIKVLGGFDTSPPSFGLPTLELSVWKSLLPSAMSIALLIYASSVLTSRLYADRNGYPFRANKELFALAAANVAAGIAQSVPVAGSDARTLLNDASGGRTQLVSLGAAAVALAVLLFLSPAMASLPSAVLGAVIIASALSLLDVRTLVNIWKLRRAEGVLSLVTLLGVLILGILPGVLLAVVLAVSDLVRRAARPHDAVLGRLEGSPGYHDIETRPGSATLPGLIVYRFDAPLFFANARFLREQVHLLVAAASEPVRMFVLDCGAMYDLDTTAAETLQKLQRELSRQRVTLALAEPHAPMRDMLRKSGLLAKLGTENVFATVGEAFRSFLSRAEELGVPVEWTPVKQRPEGA